MMGLWVGLAFSASRAMAAAVWSAITAPFRGQTGGVTVYKHVAITFARSFFRTASIEQIQYIFPPKSAHKIYESLVHSQKSTAKYLRLHDGTKAFWLGNADADNLVIYFPGGAYCMPALEGHFDLTSAIATNLKQKNQDIGVLLLEYDLIPQAQWPRQLAQGVALVQYAIEILGKQPSNIILQGDSSGAHLVLGVLSHLIEPHPHGSTPALSLQESLRGALLISPWIYFHTNHKSFTTNAENDVMSAESLGRWADAVFGSTEVDTYCHPLDAPAGWWKRLPVKRIFIGFGEDEVLLDSIISLACKMKGEHPDVQICRAYREFHAEPVTDFQLKIPPGIQFQAMLKWLNETFA